ncbi:MAG: hypothetical protein IT168_08555 [Bryobacterales bacterium]|nr:hypothetical protein [Bryobacterales bacterium]
MRARLAVLLEAKRRQVGTKPGLDFGTLFDIDERLVELMDRIEEMAEVGDVPRELLQEADDYLEAFRMKVDRIAGYWQNVCPPPPGSQESVNSAALRSLAGSSPLFSGGDCDKKYHVTLDFTQPLTDRAGNTVPMNDCRKIYMVFAPRFEQTEPELLDGCFLTAGVGPTDTVWQVDDSSKLTDGRYLSGPTPQRSVCAWLPSTPR